MRRDPIVVSYSQPPVLVTAAHQINTSQASPSIYLPQQDVAPGQKWRFRCMVRANAGNVSAGRIGGRICVDWYSATNAFKGHVDGTVYYADQGWGSTNYLTMDATVPSGVNHANVLIELGFITGTNSFAVYDVNYTKLFA